MKRFLLFASIILFMAGCVSVDEMIKGKTGEGKIRVDGELEKVLIHYFSLDSEEYGSSESKALAYNSENGRNFFSQASGRTAQQRAIDQAMKNCPGCQILAVGNRVVWKDAGDFQPLLEKAKAARNISYTESEYSTSGFSISTEQRKAFKKYLEDVDREPERTWVFVISKDGKRSFSQGSTYPRAAFKLPVWALKRCYIMSDGVPCTVYAIGKQVQ